jgi:hypothetical protein
MRTGHQKDQAGNEGVDLWNGFTSEGRRAGIEFSHVAGGLINHTNIMKPQ